MTGNRCRDGACLRMNPGLCTGCTTHAHDWLTDLPELYVRLGLTIARGQTGTTDPVTGSKDPPCPARLDVIDHMTTVGHTLRTWARTIADARGLNPPKSYPPFDFLTTHHNWTTTQPWADDYATQLHQLWARARQLTGDTPQRIHIGHCITTSTDNQPCGQPLSVTPDDTSIRCPTCRTTWPRERWLLLGAAMREVAP